MPNTFQTNTLTELVALRFAEAGGYLTVGSRAYFKDQLAGKRNGQTYEFVIRDTGEAVKGLAIGGGDKTSLAERKVSLTLEDYHVAVATNTIEGVTDVLWDKEIAQPNAKKLINKVTREIVADDLGKCGAAFVGEGFAPLSRASGHLQSIVSDKLYGFIAPQIEAVLTTNGQQFVPVGAPPMYKTGLLGEFHGAEYRAQRFLKPVSISSAVATFLNGATMASSSAFAANAVDGTLADFKIAFSSPGSNLTIPAGIVIWVDGVYACDTVGDVTDELKAFVVLADKAVTTTDTSATLSVRMIDLSSSFATSGTREAAKKDGTALALTDFNSKSIAVPAAGDYHAGYIRADGAFEFETIDKIDVEGSDYEKGSVEGVTMHKNKKMDIDNMVNKTRWDVVPLAGVVESRACAYVLVK